ncbi:type II toxin-antitoxin system VapC family toxin [Candidatus Uhrbacteria bacterium]|nr:type II toxin-antitoxin system VapC family toxin [Candidatus Uhrbacteria bacterium]
MVVVDASVALKWFLPEEGAPEAMTILNDHVFGREEIFVPDILFYEIVNALRYKPDLDNPAVEKFIEVLSWFELKRIGTDEQFLKEILQVAREFDISGYDAAYAALARIFNCSLITADTRLAQKIEGKISVRLIL